MDLNFEKFLQETGLITEFEYSKKELESINFRIKPLEDFISSCERKYNAWNNTDTEEKKQLELSKIKRLTFGDWLNEKHSEFYKSYTKEDSEMSQAITNNTVNSVKLQEHNKKIEPFYAEYQQFCSAQKSNLLN